MRCQIPVSDWLLGVTIIMAVGVGAGAEPGHPPAVNLKLGPPRELLRQGELDMSFMPDQHIAILQQPDKSYRLFVTGFICGTAGKDSTGILLTRDFLTYRPGVGTAKKTYPVLRPSGGENFDAEYAGADFVFTATNRRDLLMIYHGETRTFGHERKPAPPFPFYAQIGLARSSDNGQTWKRLGPIISGHDPKPFKIPEGYATGVFEPGAITNGGFIYVFYAYYPTPGCPDFGPPSIEVARAPVSSDGAPGAWVKYHKGAFGSQPGLGGLGSAVVPASTNCVLPQQPWVAYCSYLECFIMVFVCHDGWAFSTSLDLVTWTQPILFYQGPVPLFRPGEVTEENVILVTPGNAGGMIGRTGYLLYARTPAWARVSHSLWMRPFSFEKRE